ncbi:MAG: peptidylprolyl isomerase [Sedimentisphaerales bacterium]|nr:peptidylprolyl isomerase [Sedimentisphaerales bacterium]
MKAGYKPFVIVLIVCAVAGTAFYQGCKKEIEKKIEPSAPAVEPNVFDEPAVTVNGDVITEGEVEARLTLIMDRRGSRLDPNIAAQYKKRLRGQTLEGMIIERLLDGQVKKFNVEVDDSDVNDKINGLIGAQGFSIDTFKQLLASQGQSYEQFQEQVKKSLGYEKVLEKQAGPIDINEATALAYYEQNKEQFVKEEQVRASHILIKVSPSATIDEKAEARQKAEKLLEQVRQEDSNFAELAKENSDCPSKAEGGDLGFFPRGQMVKEFEDVAFALQPGQFSPVVETQFGFHIIKVIDHKPGVVMAFNDIKEEIQKGLAKMEAQKTYKVFIENLKTEAKIEYPLGKEPIPARREIMPRPVSPAPAPPPAPE